MRGESFAVSNRAKTHCMRGHPYSLDGYRYLSKKNGKTWRLCVKCNAEAKRQRRLKAKAKNNESK